MRQEAVEYAQDFLQNNKINISDFTPRTKVATFGVKKTAAKRRSKAMAEFGEGEDFDSEESVDKPAKKKGRINKEEAQLKLHQMQMQSLDGEIQSIIQTKIMSSPRYSQDGGSSQSSAKKSRPQKRGGSKSAKKGEKKTWIEN